jgi:hypothetical protein
MYFTINKEKISLEFKPNIFLTVNGPDEYYYVEVREYRKNEDQSLFVTGIHLNKLNNVFKLPIDFYYDFEIIIYKFIDGIGLSKIYNHRYNDYGKLVLFNLDTYDIDECVLWIERILEYQKIHGCKIAINSKFDEVNKKFESYYQTVGVDYYKIYNIGRYPKSSHDWKTIDPRKEGLIWYGNWKTFWSYQHPKSWNYLSSQEIVDNILGL